MTQHATPVADHPPSPLTHPPRSRWHAPLAALVLVAVTIATYGRVCDNAFTWWDDPMTIHHNPRYNPPSAKQIRETWVKPVDGLYVPVTYSYWGALAFLGEEDGTDALGIHLSPRVFHAGSLVLHLLSVLVAFAILKLLSDNVLASAGGALLFALHPVQVESVAWASGAKDLLFGLLSLAAIYQYAQFARGAKVRQAVLADGAQGTRCPTKARLRFLYASGAVLMILAALAKPTAMVVPAIVAALDLLVVGRPWRRVAWSAGGWVVLIVPVAIVARIVQAVEHLPTVAVWSRPFIAADAVAFYLWKMLWPVALTPDYTRRPDVVLRMAGGAWPYLIWLVPAALAAWAWRGRRARPWALAGLAVFVAGIAPMLGLTPFQFQFTSTVADHYLYLAMFGPALALTWALVRFRHRAVLGACGVALAILAVRSNDQVKHWRSEMALWTHTLAVEPNSFVARTNLAADLGRAAHLAGAEVADLREAGKADEAAKVEAERRTYLTRAVELLEQAVTISPDYIVARHNAFVNYLRLNRFDKAAEHLEVILAGGDKEPNPELHQRLVPFHESAGEMWSRAGKYARAIPHFERVLELRPNSESAKKGLQDARAKLAEARLELGQER
jgi:hypothetical protein